LPELFNGLPIQMPDGHINPDMVAALKLYVEEAKPLGGFLRSMLANDLVGASYRADYGNQRTFCDLARFVGWNVPSSMRGSYEIVNARIGPEE
jgi:hypothetical protein